LIINSIEKGLEKIVERKFLALFLVAILGIGLRVYFMPWEYPTNSPDAFVFMNEAINYSKGNFEQFNVRFIWPMFLSIFFQFSDDNSNLMTYTTIMRIVSIGVSIITIPVIYVIAKKFVSHKWAVICAAIFTLEANLVENSIFGITETIFILVGLLSFYFAIQKNEKFIILSFLFAGIAFDTRLNGIVLLIFLLVVCTTRFSGKKLVKNIILGIIIFVAISIPHIIIPLDSNEIPYLKHFVHVDTVIKEDTAFVWKESSDNVLLDAIKNEFLHILRISVPYLALFVPFGIIISLREIDWKRKMLFSIIIISLIVAIPQYTMSVEYRNLFFIVPFFAIISVIGIEGLGKHTNFKNLLLVLLIAGLLLLSFNFLRERYDVDQESLQERLDISKHVVNNLDGNISGDLRLQIWTQMGNENYKIKANDSGGFSNEKINFYSPEFRVENFEDLKKYLKQDQINFLIVDNIDDNRFPVFNQIFYKENKYSFLEKIYDTDMEKYKKIRVKIFEINYEKLE
jgi:hypothetical protein